MGASGQSLLLHAASYDSVDEWVNAISQVILNLRSKPVPNLAIAKESIASES